MSCPHNVIFVDSFNEEGAFVSCLRCDFLFTVQQEWIEKGWTPFNYTSPRGKDHDKVILVKTYLIRKEVS